MTPTLRGRWQTRLLLYAVLGLPITLLYSAYLGDGLVLSEPFVFITALLVIGLLLDVAYIQIQRFRWDNDWPFAFQFFFSILEFLITFAVMMAGFLDPFLGGRIPFSIAAIHFTLVFIPSFAGVLCGVQIFFVRWRFKGGELGKHAAK